MSINRVVLVGRLTKDPELRSTGSGTSVLAMRLAFNDRWKNPSSGEWEERSNYIDVTLFGNRAEGLSRILSKGSRIGVDGRLRWSEWETPAGEKRSKVEAIVDELELLDSREGGSGTAPAPAAPAASGGTPEGEEIPF
jgi:single-strand DNA-binding protein